MAFNRGISRFRPRRLPLLAVYLLVVLGSPMGRAGALWVHLETSHDGTGDHQTVERVRVSIVIPPLEGGQMKASATAAHDHSADPDPAPGEPPHGHPHPHSHDGPAHPEPEPVTPALDTPQGHDHGPPAPNVPHEHDGFVHTHDDPAEGNAALVVAGMSELHISPQVSLFPILPADRIAALVTDERAVDHVPLIETPPPRVV